MLAWLLRRRELTVSAADRRSGPAVRSTDIKIRSTTELGDNNSIKKQREARKETQPFPNRGRKMPALDDDKKA